MKSLKFPFILMACLMIWNFSVGQSIILKADTVPFGLDSTAVVRLPEYRGMVKWQVSYDKTNWHDILQSNRDSILVDRDVDAWYRAEVSDGTCNKVYSDTVIVQNSDTFEITPYVPIQDIHGVVEGEQVSVIYNNDTIVCVKDSNEYIFQGDIVFTEDELIFLNDLKGASLPVWSFTERLWPEGKVYYKNTSWNLLLRSQVARAIDHWEENTPLEFIDIEDAPEQLNFIEFVSTLNKTNSQVGMVGRKQLIRIASYQDEYAVRHEIGHAIGLYHEHSRADREKYIIVDKGNLKDPDDINYALFKNSFCFGDFDYISLMLYPSKGGTAAIDDIKPILKRLDGGIWHDDLVQRELSPGDIAMVNYLYSAPHVKTAGVTDFLDNTAVSGGVVYYDARSSVTERGICWNTSGNPEVDVHNTTTNGSGTGSFTSMITDLEPGRTYYVRAYAKNKNGIGYGNQIVFENDPSVSLPSVDTNPIDVRIYYSSSGTRDSVKTFAPGQVSDDGGAPVLERGVCWNKAGNASTADETKVDSDPGTGNYTIKIADFITYDTQYSLRAFASNKKGTSYGEEIVFAVHPFEEDFPSIRTNEVAAVTGNSAKCGGIISTGTVSAFSSRGVFYSTHNNPTVIDQVADIGPGGNGGFEVNLTGLESEKWYYARAYAVTDQGTLYGSVVSFTTAAEENQTGTFIDPRDGNVYNWVEIGDQVWMAENLAWLPSVNPSSIGSEEQPYFYVYDYNGTDPSIAKASSKYTACGVLYNWPAAVNACPAGWHLPGDEEWKQLEIYLGMNQIEVGNTGIRGTDQGSQLKTISGWLYGGDGTNSSGFSGSPGGYRDFDGPFESNEGTAIWWSSTEFSEGFSWYRCLNFDFDGVDRNGFYKSAGVSIRCLKDLSPITMASLVTSSMTNITQNGANGGGEITSDGGDLVSARGVCWNTSGNPTINDDKTSDGQGIGPFSSILVGLTANTTYYVRAYATNSQGTAYGNEVTFTTDNITTSGTFADPRDNHEYKWVQIGDQTWMAENLAFDAGAGSWAFNNEDSIVALYGRIYDWTTSLSACPAGWHLPSFEEWNILAAYISSDKGPYVNIGDQWEFVGGHLKSTTGWKNNGNGTDDYGFNGIPVMGIGFFEGEYAGWWSSDETSVGGASAFHRFLYFEHGTFRFTNHPKEFGYSVRCIKN